MLKQLSHTFSVRVISQFLFAIDDFYGPIIKKEGRLSVVK